MKGRTGRASGGPTSGDNLADDDLSRKNKRYTYQSNVNDEAEERKRGGKAVKMSGSKGKANAGRKPRKSGGRAYSDNNPFTSACKGTPPKGHSTPGGAN